MRLALALALSAAPALAETCPPNPDIAAEMAPFYEALKDAPNEMAAEVINREMWARWTRAPDARAQALLDEGMGARAVADYDAARAAFDALVAYCPDYAEGYNQRAFINFLRQDYGRALEDLDIALGLSPRHVGALSGKALTLMGLGRVKAARGVMQEALALNPWLAERHMIPSEAPGTDL